MNCCTHIGIKKRNYYCDHELNRYLETLAALENTFIGSFGEIDFKTTLGGTALKCNSWYPDKLNYILPITYTYGKQNGNLWRGETQRSEDHACLLIINKESGSASLLDTNNQASQRDLVRDRLKKRLNRVLGFSWKSMSEIDVPTLEHGCSLAASTLIRFKVSGMGLKLFNGIDGSRQVKAKRYKELMLTKSLISQFNQTLKYMSSTYE